MPPPLRVGPLRGGGSGSGGSGGSGGGGGGGWGRLRPADVDPLEAYGLPSKGETRLADFKTQERYYGKIIERYLQFCSDANGRDGLLARFASLEVSSGPASAPAVLPTTASVSALAAASRDLSLVLGALRTLREAIVATDRGDEFATQVYLFCIRLAILAKHPQSYHPALLHLLRHIHRRCRPLSSVELHEVATYRVLDAACRRGDLAEAYHLRCLYRLRSATVDAALRALAHDDWVALRRLLPGGAPGAPSGASSGASGASSAGTLGAGTTRGSVADAHEVKLLEYAVHDMRVHTLKCFGRAYLRLDDVRFLERATGLGWAALQSQYNVGWERDGDAVVLRKVPPRNTAAAAAAAAAAASAA